MTNFEKWKSELRPEDFIEIYEEDNSMQCKGAICKICPVRKSCEKLVNPFVTEADIFLDWANTEVGGKSPTEQLREYVQKQKEAK